MIEPRWVIVNWNAWVDSLLNSWASDHICVISDLLALTDGRLRFDFVVLIISVSDRIYARKRIYYLSSSNILVFN